MARSRKAQRFAQWLARHRGWRQVLRLLLLAVLALAAGLLTGWAGLPEWTMIGWILPLLFCDDWLDKRWAARQGRTAGENTE